MLNNNRILNYQMTYLSTRFEQKTSKAACEKSITEHNLLLVLSVGRRRPRWERSYCQLGPDVMLKTGDLGVRLLG
jgi:hypothetical protein